MKTFFFLLVSLFVTLNSFGQKVEVMTLGTFHFAFPNHDVRNIGKDDQIDILEPKYQREIQDLISRLAKFKPTIIAIEREPDKQGKYDSLYNKFLQDNYTLRRNEEEQIGFRLAKKLGLKKLHCIDSWNRYYDDTNKVLDKKDSLEFKKFMSYLYDNPDKPLEFFPKNILKSKGILAQLKAYNEDDSVKRSLGNYLIGIFKYETRGNEFFGPDFVTGWGFNRNLKIFRNLQKINAKPSDRILVIYGYGHLAFLNPLLESSPEFKLVKVVPFLN